MLNAKKILAQYNVHLLFFGAFLIGWWLQSFQQVLNVVHYAQLHHESFNIGHTVYAFMNSTVDNWRSEFFPQSIELEEHMQSYLKTALKLLSKSLIIKL
jgi:hypothetical protein